MDDFRERLRRIRQTGEKAEARDAEEEREKARRARETTDRVDSAADEVEAYIERCLKDFQAEFVEFRFDSHTREGLAEIFESE